MEKPSLYERLHWGVFNAGVKLFGFLLLIWSATFAILFVIDLAQGSTWYGMGWLATLIAVLVCLLLGTIGVAIVKAKPFRPSQYDEYYKNKQK